MIAALLSLVGWLGTAHGHRPLRVRVARAGHPTFYSIECSCAQFKTPPSLHKQTAANHWRDHARAVLADGRQGAIDDPRAARLG